MSKFCDTCAFLTEQNGATYCGVSGLPVNRQTDFCSQHTKEVNKCQICGSVVVNANSVWCGNTDGTYSQYCTNCAHSLSSCRACKNMRSCAFETDPNPMPKIVQQQVQQGNMTMMTQVKNPERIKLFCSNCCCWSEECGCMKEFGIGCEKQERIV